CGRGGRRRRRHRRGCGDGPFDAAGRRDHAQAPPRVEGAGAMTEPRWLAKDLILAVHNRQLEEHGGMSGVRDEGLLESALARPQNLFAYGESDAAALAAAYAFGIARNH